MKRNNESTIYEKSGKKRKRDEEKERMKKNCKFGKKEKKMKRK